MYDPAASPPRGPQRCHKYASNFFENCAVVGTTELKRLVTLTQGGIADQQRKQNELETQKDERKQLSEERASTWRNTIKNRRIQSERTLETRLLKDEERRRVLDGEEAELVREKRRQTMELAEKKLFVMNDKVKTFHSYLQTYHTIVERDKQLTVQKQQAEMRARREAAVSAGELAAVEAKAQEDLLRTRESKMKALDAKLSQKKQIHNQREALRALRVDGSAEREKLSSAARDEVNEEHQRIQLARAAAAQTKAGVKEQLAEKLEVRTKNKLAEIRTASRIERNSFIETKVDNEAFIEERCRNRWLAKMETLQKGYESLDSIRHRKEAELNDLASKRQMNGVLGVGDRITENDHQRVTERLAQKNDPNLHGGVNAKKVTNDQRVLLADHHRQQIIKVNSERALQDELEELNAKKRESRRVAQIHLLQKKEKEVRKIQERLQEYEERRQNDHATNEMNLDAKRYIGHSLRALPQVAQKYMGGSGESATSPGHGGDSPARMLQRSPGNGLPGGGFDAFSSYNSDGSPKSSSTKQLLHPVEVARQQLLQYSTKMQRHQA